MGMDRVIKKRKIPIGLIIGIAAVAALCLVFGYQLLIVDKKPIQTADKSKIRISTVIEGDFQEYFQVNGFVSAAQSIFIDARENGIVETVSREQGDVVRKGEVLMTMSNDNLESERLLKKTSLENRRQDLEEAAIRAEQAAVRNRQDLLEIDHRIDVLTDQYGQAQAQFASHFMPETEFRTLEKELAFWQEKKGIMLTAQELDAALVLREKQRIAKAMEIDAMDLDRLEKRIGTLTVTAPAPGQLTAFDVSVGETRSAGSRLAQLDVMDAYSLKANVDEYYLPSVRLGTKGSFAYTDGNGEKKDFTVTLSWMSPDVKSNSFEAEFDFDALPPGTRIGQRFLVRVELGERKKSVMLEQGPFFSSGAGSYVYVVDPAGGTAHKRDVTIGKTNPEYLQVTQGLQPGEKVVISDYSGFHGLDTVTIR